MVTHFVLKAVAQDTQIHFLLSTNQEITLPQYPCQATRTPRKPPPLPFSQPKQVVVSATGHECGYTVEVKVGYGRHRLEPRCKVVYTRARVLKPVYPGIEENAIEAVRQNGNGRSGLVLVNVFKDRVFKWFECSLCFSFGEDRAEMGRDASILPFALLHYRFEVPLGAGGVGLAFEVFI